MSRQSPNDTGPLQSSFTPTTDSPLPSTLSANNTMKPSTDMKTATASASTPATLESKPSISTSTSTPKPTPAPIITYPEFLTRKRQHDRHYGAASLSTTRAIYRVVIYTLYISGAISAAVLALSQYYVNPMRNALSEARREFARHVVKVLGGLNQKIESMVVARGIEVVKGGRLRFNGDRVSESDAESRDDEGSMKKVDVDAGSSDGNDAATEFYQRDVGTQTSPALMFRQSSSQSQGSLQGSETGTSASAGKSPSEVIVAQHERQVSSLHTNVLNIIDDGRFDEIQEKGASRQVAALKKYLEGLTQAAQFAVIGDERSHVFHTARAMKSGGAAAADGDKGKENIDAAQELKAEVRRLKGYLLSARNFPVPGGGRRMLAGKGR